MGLIDFTNPAACDWYVACLNKLFDIGVDALKTDFGERVPSRDVQWHDTSVDPGKMHNYYAFIYNKLVYEALQARYGADQAVLFARSATAGTQRFPLQWGGDCESTFEAMAESLRGGLSLGLCGYAFWSVDIGGFEGTPDAAVYKRWVQFGLLCSHSRLHGSNSYRVPWLVDDDDQSEEGCSAVLRKFAQLKCRLMPYLWSESQQAIKHGWPVSVRAMALEFPEDRTAWSCDTQFMLGSRILVAPVFDQSGEVEFYLPTGKWTSWWDGKAIEGPKWVKETHGFTTLPIYVRQGTLLVLGKEGEKRTVWDWRQDVEVKLFEPDAETGFTLFDQEGKELGTLGAEEVNGEWKVSGQDILD